MGTCSSMCKPRTKIVSSSWNYSENDNPFETSFTKKERICLRETFHRLCDPKEIIGKIFIDLVNDICPEFKKTFGVDFAPRANMIKMPKLGGHVSRMTDFLEQMTTMVGFVENLLGAWQLVRKTGRLHAKIPFLEQNQSQLENGRNYIAIVNSYLSEHFIPYLTQEKPETNIDPKKELEKKKIRMSQVYTTIFIAEVWKRFLKVITAQMIEAFELERQKCLNANNQKMLAPHQHAEDEEKRRRQNAERQSELASQQQILEEKKEEELFEDPF